MASRPESMVFVMELWTSSTLLRPSSLTEERLPRMPCFTPDTISCHYHWGEDTICQHQLNTHLYGVHRQGWHDLVQLLTDPVLSPAPPVLVLASILTSIGVSILASIVLSVVVTSTLLAHSPGRLASPQEPLCHAKEVDSPCHKEGGDQAAAYQRPHWKYKLCLISRFCR